MFSNKGGSMIDHGNRLLTGVNCFQNNILRLEQNTKAVGMNCFRIHILSLDENTKPVSGLFPLRGKKVTLEGIYSLPRRKAPFHWRHLASAPVDRLASAREGTWVCCPMWCGRIHAHYHLCCVLPVYPEFSHEETIQDGDGPQHNWPDLFTHTKISISDKQEKNRP